MGLEKMGNDLVRKRLCEIIVEDPSLHNDAARCQGMLSDRLLGQYIRETEIIVAAIKESIPAKLVALQGKGLTHAQLDSFKKELQNKRYLNETAAQWVIESWALALKVNFNTQCVPTPSNPTVPTMPAPTPSPTVISPPTTPAPAPSPSGFLKLSTLKKTFLVGGGILILLVLGIFTILQSKMFNREQKVSSDFPPATPSPTVIFPSTTPVPAPSPTVISPSTTPVPAPSPTVISPPIPPIRLVPLPPTINEINNAISRLEAMNPSEILEFPIEENPNYRVIGFKVGTNEYFGWNVRTVKRFLQESIQHNGKFSQNDQITLIVRNQLTNKRLILNPRSKNNLLGLLVRSINAK